MVSVKCHTTTLCEAICVPMMLLLFACGLAVAQSATTQTTPTTAPTTRPYAGLTLRDDPSGKVLVSHIAPGPLEGRGFKSPHLFRGDTILAITIEDFRLRRR